MPPPERLGNNRRTLVAYHLQNERPIGRSEPLIAASGALGWRGVRSAEASAIGFGTAGGPRGTAVANHHSSDRGRSQNITATGRRFAPLPAAGGTAR
jgi:hypothetical protein